MNAMVPEAKAAVLDSSVAGILLRFQISQADIVSAKFWTEEYTPRPAGRLNNRPQGTTVVEEQEVGLGQFLNDLGVSGFVLADMVGTRMPAGQNPFGRVSFFFKKEADPAAIVYAREEFHPVLRRLADTALWSVKVERNRKVDGVEGREGLFLKIGGRTPLAHPNGTPMLRRRKDDRGKPIGDPQPLQPERFLRIIDGRIILRFAP